jgi:hypothetical protein
MCQLRPVALQKKVALSDSILIIPNLRGHLSRMYAKR